jgi:hypothetical protein
MMMVSMRSCTGAIGTAIVLLASSRLRAQVTKKRKRM